MSRCLSFTTARDRCYRRSFSSAGLRPTSVSLHDGATRLHVWVPVSPDACRPPVLLIHGFGARATWQWDVHLRPLLRAGFNLYVPDLVFFGESTTTRPERNVDFQAACLAEAMDVLGVGRASLVGISYGGFVGYALAAAWPERVDRVALCCSGVCLEEKDLREKLFVVDNVQDATALLIPQTPERLRRLMQLSFVRPARGIPSCFLSDFIDVMCAEHVQEKTELIIALIKDRKLCDLPNISQPTLIIWGDKDQIFPLELGHRLRRHLEQNSELVIIKNAGHAVNLEKPKEFCKHLKSFLLGSTTELNQTSHKVGSSLAGI